MGRPPVSKTEPTEQCTVRLTPSQREKRDGREEVKAALRELLDVERIEK